MRIWFAALLTLLTMSATAVASVGFVHESTFTFPQFAPDISRVNFVDYNSDGQPELLAVNDTLVVLWDITGDSVIFSHATDTLHPHTRAVVGDVNRDSIPDLVLVVAVPDTAYLNLIPVPTDWQIICFDGALGFTDSTFAVHHSWAPWSPIEYSQGLDFLMIEDIDGDGECELFYSHRYLSFDQWSSFEGGFTILYARFPDSIQWTEPFMAMDALSIERANNSRRLICRELDGSSLETSDESNTEIRLVDCDSLGQLTTLSPECVDTGCGGGGFRDCVYYAWESGNLIGSSEGDEVIGLRGYSLFCPAPPAGELTVELVLFGQSSIGPNGPFDELWSVSYQNQLPGLGNFMIHPNLPGYFFGIADDTLFMFRGENGSIRYQMSDIPHGQRYWETDWPDSIPRLVVMNGNQVDIYSLDITTAVEDEPPTSLPDQFVLGQPYPNPFNAELSIPISLPNAAHVKVEIYNLLGQTVVTLVDGRLSSGESRLSWNATGHPSGIYLMKASFGDKTETRKLILLK
ncbi:MAG: T9SS type A sorting domain-containing protein [bacterium]|nr:T9SS type A sorting domain-containing protein [bacterium]